MQFCVVPGEICKSTCKISAKVYHNVLRQSNRQQPASMMKGQEGSATQMPAQGQQWGWWYWQWWQRQQRWQGQLRPQWWPASKANADGDGMHNDGVGPKVKYRKLNIIATFYAMVASDSAKSPSSLPCLSLALAGYHVASDLRCLSFLLASIEG